MLCNLKMFVKAFFTVQLVILFVLCFFCFNAFADFNPEAIPEEELSAIASDYYDEVDERIEEKVQLLSQVDRSAPDEFSPYEYMRSIRPALNNAPIVKWYDYRNNLIGPTSNYANYNRENAAAYALTYALSPNSAYKELDSDCTNFVSQAIATGNVYSYINSNFDSSPPVYQNWILDTASNYWYMVKKNRILGLNYWQYSKSWAFVSDFRTFHKARSASGKNYFGGWLTSGGTAQNKYIPNTTQNENINFEYKLRKNAQVGQVWQCGDEHSIIITKVAKFSDGYNYVWYSCHSTARKNEDIQTFFNWVYTQQNNAVIHRLDFS